MMNVTTILKKYVLPNMPYTLIFWVTNKIGEAYRITPGIDFAAKITGSLLSNINSAFAEPMLSFHPTDLLFGVIGTVIFYGVVYYKKKNAKKFRNNVEYGSARWGNKKDIAPYIDPKPDNNVILTATESLTINGRPKNPKYARNKNVLVIGGSGSGKTRFWLKPNIMQCQSKDYPVSFCVTDPKGSILVECGKLLQRNHYQIKVLNTIDFKKSLHYNPFPLLYKGGKRNNPQNTRQSLRLRHKRTDTASALQPGKERL